MALTKAKLIELIDSGDIDVGGGNPNLLHNWDFRNPVNQRGVSGEFTTSSGYFYDRWKLGLGTVYLNSGYIVIKASMNQLSEHDLTGKVVTFSYLTSSGIIYSKTLTVPTTNIYNVPGIAQLDIGGSSVRLYNAASATTQIAAVKLELGTASTLHLDPPMDHAVELLKCQRFYLNIYGAKPAGIAYSTTFAVLFLPTVCPMRTVPTSQAGTINVYHNGSTQTVSIVEIYQFPTGLEIKVQGTFTVNQVTIGAPTTSPHGLTSDL